MLLQLEARYKCNIQSECIQREQTVSFCRSAFAAPFHFAAHFHPQLQMYLWTFIFFFFTLNSKLIYRPETHSAERLNTAQRKQQLHPLVCFELYFLTTYSLSPNPNLELVYRKGIVIPALPQHTEKTGTLRRTSTGSQINLINQS